MSEEYQLSPERSRQSRWRPVCSVLSKAGVMLSKRESITKVDMLAGHVTCAPGQMLTCANGKPDVIRQTAIDMHAHCRRPIRSTEPNGSRLHPRVLLRDGPLSITRYRGRRTSSKHVALPSSSLWALLYAIAYFMNPRLRCTVGTTENRVMRLHAMADDATATVGTLRCKNLDRTFKAIKHVGLTLFRHLKGLIVVIATIITSGHDVSPL